MVRQVFFGVLCALSLLHAAPTVDLQPDTMPIALWFMQSVKDAQQDYLTHEALYEDIADAFRDAPVFDVYRELLLSPAPEGDHYLVVQYQTRDGVKVHQGYDPVGADVLTVADVSGRLDALLLQMAQIHPMGIAFTFSGDLDERQRLAFDYAGTSRNGNSFFAVRILFDWANAQPQSEPDGSGCSLGGGWFVTTDELYMDGI